MTWPTFDRAALYGLTGEVVGAIAPETEADPAALAATFLAGFGNAVGAGPHARVSGAEHPARLHVVVVGESARSRKGSSWTAVRGVLASADDAWSGRVLSGFGSGEAVIDAVRDPTEDDPGPGDYRALVREGEFARILRVAARESSTLGTVIRDAWDGEPLQSRTVGRGVRRATAAHVSVLAHITREELEREMASVDVVNGFANRFLFVCARRARKLPTGGNLDDQVVVELGRKVHDRLDKARALGIMRRTPAAEARWADWYNALPDDPVGAYGAVTARADAQTLRLSVVYALTDAAPKIDLCHLDAALALWSYCDQSARYVFATVTGDPVADKLLARLVELGPAKGLDGREQHGLFAGHVTARRLADARDLLASLGFAETTEHATGGRPRHVTFLSPGASEESEESEESAVRR